MLSNVGMAKWSNISRTLIRTRISSERLRALFNEISMKSSLMEIRIVCTLTWNNTHQDKFNKDDDKLALTVSV